MIHLGAYPSVAHHPAEQVFTNNTGAAAHVAAACAGLGIKRVVYASSITTYGLEEQCTPGRRTLPPGRTSRSARPRTTSTPSPSGSGKRSSPSAAGEHGLAVASLRIALVVGPDEYAERGRPRGHARCLRRLWAYVDSRDVAQAARLAIEHLEGLGPGNHPFNVGAADAHSELPLSDRHPPLRAPS